MNDFELFFRDFVRDFGGELLAESNLVKTADYLFLQDSIVAELKTLTEDARLDHTRKLQELVNEWIKRRWMMAFGRVQISLQKLPPICQQQWLDILTPPVENIIRKANQQIRATKEVRNIPTAKGVLLIANDGNFLHTSEIDYLILLARVLQKKAKDGSPKFPHIDGVVYFSYRIGGRSGLPFWAPAHLNLDVIPFQEKLKNGWFSYVAKVHWVRVQTLSREVK